MKVAGNRISQMLEYWHRELDEVFGKEETEALFRMAADHYLNIPGNQLQAKLQENMNQSDLLLLYDCCKELNTGKPLQHITHTAWFYGRRFFVNEDVLIPRPETEELCEHIIHDTKKGSRILDLCSGSGCIAVTLKVQVAGATVFACELSDKALKIAQMNAEQNDAEILFMQADVLNEEEMRKSFTMKFDVMISNPPYVKRNESASLSKQVLDHEPHLALFVEGEDDILFYRKIILLSEHLLVKGGRLWFELNPLTAEKVLELAEGSGYLHSCSLIKDLSGNVRFLRGERS